MQNEACFLYVMEGKHESVSENDRLSTNAHESVLMKCGNYLSKMYASGQSPRYEAVAVHFYPDVLGKIYEKVPKFLKSNDNVPSVGMGKVNSDVIIRKYIESILFYFDNPELVNEEILILKLKEIILLLNQTKNAPAIRSILANLFNPTTYTFREIIEAHVYSNMTVTELALLTNMSLSSFKREFVKIYDQSPAAYLRDKKLEKAVGLLLSSDLRTTEIAYDCGFSDVAHFSKAFKQKYAVSPTAFKVSQMNKTMG